MAELQWALELDQPILILIAVVAIIGLAIGWLIAHALNQRHMARLAATLELERRTASERHAALEQTFSALSATALRENNEAFLNLARYQLGQFHIEARGELAVREKAVEGLVRPIRDLLERSQHQLETLERDRREAQGALNKHFETLAQTQQALQSETRNLVQALRRPEVRGQWGELTLRRLVELAGMVEHCDFVEQIHTPSEDGVLRPDMLVHMPSGREVIVDVKTPLDAYLSAVESADETTRQKYLAHHARKVREHIRDLAGKAYWSQFAHSPEFVIMFIPGEQLLSAALDQDRNLIETALSQKVILATPTSLVALLRAIAYGWRQESLNSNAEQIRLAGEELYNRLATLTEHLSKLGRGLDNSVTQYNRLVGSFESKVLPGARKFTEMGITAKKELDEQKQIETGTREVSGADN